MPIKVDKIGVFCYAFAKMTILTSRYFCVKSSLELCEKSALKCKDE